MGDYMMEKSGAWSDVSSISSKPTERSRWPPLTRMLLSGELSGEAPRELTLREKFDRWMVNEGYRRLFVFVFIAVHAMIFAFGFMNYDLKDNLTTARATFGITYPIARSAALVLHFDIAMVLLRKYHTRGSALAALLTYAAVCRTLISIGRQTPLNGIIQFGKDSVYIYV